MRSDRGSSDCADATTFGESAGADPGAGLMKSLSARRSCVFEIILMGKTGRRAARIIAVAAGNFFEFVG